ncbi:hypothetical protein K440DRAFT_604870 [Wilcoxina mikolae CBS 423.85]|nr:hypothetical protein K440DRAFT_604870 [Wilcoxina mikolae CBS 423.85]
MSFGFSISDFITVTQLALQLYDSCYKAVKEAPVEFLELCNELAALKFALDHIRTDLQRPESKIRSHGEDRFKSLKSITENLYVTLLQLAKLVDKYRHVARKTTTATLWTKIRWTTEQGNIAKLRSRLTTHVGALNLVVSSIGKFVP